MISVFQVFRIVIGAAIFIFILTFFLRASGTYTGVQSLAEKHEMISAFNQVAMQTYTSGNPGTFSGFTGFETLVYDPPKIKSDAGQKTLTVPVLFITGKGKIAMERKCSSFAWFSSCWVYAYPESGNILFTFIENTEETRNLVKEAVRNLPDGIGFGYCNGTYAQVSTKENFLSYVDRISGKSYVPCEVEMSEAHRAVSVGVPPAGGNGAMVIDPSSMTISENASGTLVSSPYTNGSHVSAFIFGGKNALEYMESLFSERLGTAIDLMKKRVILVHQSMKKYNVEPCLECATPFPRECGWADYRGRVHDSTLYVNLIKSLNDLKNAMVSENYDDALSRTVSDYEELKRKGCEE